jgi:pyrroline-5-carboxylate reductase
MKISFIGFGNMAQALAQHLIKIPDYTIFAAAPSLSIGKNREGIQTHYDNKIIIQDSDIVILAVKPQVAMPVLHEIAESIAPKSVLLSIATGLRLASLAAPLPVHQPIVRSMPNLPIAVGKSTTPLIANEYVTAEQKTKIQALFEQAGITNWVNQESEMDLYTAVVGSGPAYVFYFFEALISAGVKLGLEQNIVKDFVLQMATGALTLANTSDLTLSELRKKITSPGGTTAAALNIFQHHDFNAIILEAIEAAVKRAQVLGLSN